MLSIIVPVYNEIDTIEEVLKKVQKVPLKKEIIVVDDGSTDGTKEKLKDQKPKTKDRNLKVIYKKRNEGKGTAIREGIKHVTGDYTVIQDADLEYDPNDFVKMLNAAQNNDADIVYGSRFTKIKKYKGMAWKNFIANMLFAMMTNILYKAKITDEATCYKMFKTDVLKSVDLKCRRFEFCPEVTAKLSKKGYKICEVPISYFPRDVAAGKKIKFKDGLETIWTLLKYRFFD